MAVLIRFFMFNAVVGGSASYNKVTRREFLNSGLFILSIVTSYSS